MKMVRAVVSTGIVRQISCTTLSTSPAALFHSLMIINWVLCYCSLDATKTIQSVKILPQSQRFPLTDLADHRLNHGRWLFRQLSACMYLIMSS